MGGPAFATAAGGRFIQQPPKQVPFSTPRLNAGLPQHIKATFFVRRLIESLRSGDGILMESKWSDVDEHCDGDEALRQVLVAITEAARAFLAEAPAMPALARLLRLRHIQEEIDSLSAALLPTGDLSDLSYAADVVPWGQAVRALIEALGAAGSEGSTHSSFVSEPPAWCLGSDGEKQSGLATPPLAVKIQSPPLATREAAAPIVLAGNDCTSLGSSTPTTGSNAPSGNCVTPQASASSSPQVPPRGADLDLMSAPIWRTAVTYFHALEACLRDADVRRVCRPPPALTARLPPHCRETVREIGIRVSALARSANAPPSSTAVTTGIASAESARTTAAAAMWVLLRRLMLQVEAADQCFEADNTGSKGGARAELQAALERAATAAGELLSRRGSPASVEHATTTASPEALDKVRQMDNLKRRVEELEQAAKASEGYQRSQEPKICEPAPVRAEPAVPVAAAGTAPSALLGSGPPTSSSARSSPVLRGTRLGATNSDMQHKPAKRQGAFQPVERPKGPQGDAGAEDHDLGGAGGGCLVGIYDDPKAARARQASSALPTPLPVPLRLPARYRSASPPRSSSEISPDAVATKSGVGESSPSSRSAGRAGGSTHCRGNGKRASALGEKAGRDSESAANRGSQGNGGVATPDMRSSSRTPPQSPTPPVRQWTEQAGGLPGSLGRPPPPLGPPIVTAPPSKHAAGSNTAPAQQRRNVEVNGERSSPQTGVRRSSGGGNGGSLRCRATSPNSSAGVNSPTSRAPSQQASRASSPHGTPGSSGRDCHKAAHGPDAARRAAVEERLAAATGALAEAKGLLCSRGSKLLASTLTSQAGERNLENHLVNMVNSIQASLDIACDTAGKMVSPGGPGRNRQSTSSEEPSTGRSASLMSHDGRRKDITSPGGQQRRTSPSRGPGRLIAAARPEAVAKASVQAPPPAISNRGPATRGSRPVTNSRRSVSSEPGQQQVQHASPGSPMSPQADKLVRKSSGRKAVSPQPQSAGSSPAGSGPARRSPQRPSMGPSAGGHDSGARDGAARGRGDREFGYDSGNQRDVRGRDVVRRDSDVRENCRQDAVNGIAGSYHAPTRRRSNP